ncbi:hypothetical protein LEFCBN_LEFCBN_11985, partial [Dysosmobacter welbionis]
LAAPLYFLSKNLEQAYRYQPSSQNPVSKIYLQICLVN